MVSTGGGCVNNHGFGSAAVQHGLTSTVHHAELVQVVLPTVEVERRCPVSCDGLRLKSQHVAEARVQRRLWA
eukprot:3321103-Pleurochrysis_carterae.AAC.2